MSWHSYVTESATLQEDRRSINESAGSSSDDTIPDGAILRLLSRFQRDRFPKSRYPASGPSHPSQSPQYYPPAYGKNPTPPYHPPGQAPSHYAHHSPPLPATQPQTLPNFNPYTQQPPTDPLPMTNKNDPLGLDSLGLGDLGFSSHPSSSKHSKSQKEKEEEEMMNQIAEEVVLEAVLGVHLSEEDKAMVDGLSAVEDAGEASKQQEQEDGDELHKASTSVEKYIPQIKSLARKVGLAGGGIPERTRGSPSESRSQKDEQSF